jgi:hypothetical protein
LRGLDRKERYPNMTDDEIREVEDITKREGIVAKLKQKALGTKASSDINAYLRAQDDLELMRLRSRTYQDQLREKREDRRSKEEVIGKPSRRTAQDNVIYQ